MRQLSTAKLVLGSVLATTSALTATPTGAACRPSRRAFISGIAANTGMVIVGSSVRPASAFIAGEDEEKSGLVVLRVAEVCNFQEKLLRSLAACANPAQADEKDQFGNPYCGGEAYSVNPTQIVFGTGVMLRNANLDGNLKVLWAVSYSWLHHGFRSAHAVFCLYCCHC